LFKCPQKDETFDGFVNNAGTKFLIVILDLFFMKCILVNILLICFAGSSSAAIVIPSDNKLVHSQLSAVNNKLTSDLNRAAFYKAIQSDNKILVDAQISELNSIPANIKDAFLGAMTMRRAGIGGNPVSKLKLFKKGHKLLEAAIKQDPNNTEYRFLRLMIQENAPGILGYKIDEEKDSEYIRKSYKSLPEDLQRTIADYNKTSKILKLQVS